jgi:hypothetical protein
MHRPTVGILAVVLLVAGGIFLVLSAENDSWQTSAAGCLRMGAILAVLWLALPEVTRPVSRWILVAILAGIFLLARRPQLIVPALVILAAVAMLWPRWKSFAGRPR